MLKGVNKTVIEINCTDHGYFERAILFINPEQSHMSQKRLHAEAQKYIDLIGSDMNFIKVKTSEAEKKDSSSKRIKLLVLLSAALFASLGILVLVLNIL